MESFCESYGRALSEVARNVQYPAAFFGYTFDVDEDGDASTLCPPGRARSEQRMSQYMVHDLEEQLMELDWDKVRANEDEELGATFEVNKFLDVSITYMQHVSVEVLCTDRPGLEAYLAALGHDASADMMDEP